MEPTKTRLAWSGFGSTIATGRPWAAPPPVAALSEIWEVGMNDYVHPETLVDADWVAQHIDDAAFG